MCCKVEVQRQDATLKGTLEPSLPRPIPLSIDNLEGNVLVWSSTVETKDAEIIGICRFQKVLGSLGRIHQVGVENVEGVSLYNLGGRSFSVVMRLIVLVPVVPCLDAVEVSRFAWGIPILPRVCFLVGNVDLVSFTELFFGISKVGIDIFWNHGIAVFIILFTFLLLRSSLGSFFLALFQLFKLADQHFLMYFRKIQLGQVDHELLSNSLPIFSVIASRRGEFGHDLVLHLHQGRP
mmetsp:Transcript_34822/g.84357  ORF Transcript_34822/g.84357 Transcript_34822/m.84357 type:complete len:236 (-) Transcript_34822:1146-1853(-)